MKPVTDPALLSQLNGSGAIADANLLQALNRPRVSDEMSTGERFLAGIGRGMTELGQGAKQLGLHAGGALGLADPKTVSDYDRDVAEEAALFHDDLGQTTSGKVGQVTGQVVATLPIGGAGGVGGRALVSTLGRSALQGGAIGALQPVEDVRQPQTVADLVTGDAPQGEDFLSAKIKQVGSGAAFGAGSNAALRGVGALVENALPSNVVKRVLNSFNAKANETPFAKDGESLASQTGVDLSPAQVSGSKAMAAAENAARQSIHSRDVAFAGDQRRVGQLADYFDKTMERISKSEADPVSVGTQVRDATKAVLGRMQKARADAAERDYGAVRELTKGTAAIEPTNTNKILQGVLDEYGGIGTPGGDSLAAFDKKQLANVAPGTKAGLNDIDRAAISHFGGMEKMTPDLLATAERWSPGITKRLQGATNSTAPAQGNLDKLMQLRSYFSKVAGGEAKISGDNVDRKIARDLLGAIDQDLEAASASLPGDIGAALKTANANYRAMSSQIDSVKGSPLGKIIGQDFAGALESGEFNSIAPEMVAQRLNSLKPTQLSVVKGILAKQDPEAWDMMRRHVLQDALEKAKQIPASEGANTAVLRPNVLVKTLGDRKKLEAIFEPDELRQIEAGLSVARRLSDKTGFNFSGTASQAEALDLLNDPIKAAIKLKTGGLFGLAKDAVSYPLKGLGVNAVAKIMNDANGRAALLKLSRLPEGSAKAREIAAYLAAVGGEVATNKPGEAEKAK